MTDVFCEIKKLGSPQNATKPSKPKTEPIARSIPQAKQSCPVKAALGLPKAVLLEPKLWIDQKTGYGLAEPKEILIPTLECDLQRFPAVQGQNAKQRRSVYLKTVGADQNPEGLLAAEGGKFLNIPERMKTNHEFPHKRSPRYCTN